MTIEDLEALLSMAVACGLVLRCWLIPMSILHDIIRRAPGGGALILNGDGVKIAGLPVEIVQVGGPSDVSVSPATMKDIDHGAGHDETAGGNPFDRLSSQRDAHVFAALEKLCHTLDERCCCAPQERRRAPG